MKNTRRAAALMLVFAFLAALLSGCTVPNTEKEQKTGLVNVKDEMYDASYWTAKYKQKDKVTLTSEEILHFNIRTIQNADSMEDITYYSNSLGGVQLGVYLKEYAFPEGTLYGADGEILYQPPETTVDDDGNTVEGEETYPFKAEVLENRAADETPESNSVFYALALRNTQLRSFPTRESAFASPGTQTRDLFRVCSLNIGDPLVVLYLSADEEWYFVQTRTCRGWVDRNDIVKTDKSDWLNFIRADKFIVVTDAAVTVPARSVGEAPLTLYMGTMLPLYTPGAGSASTILTDGSYVVLVPEADEFGNYTTAKYEIPMSAGVHEGYLSYTAQNVLDTAFKLSGQKLHAGGYGGGWDENSFFTAVFSCFGIYLPFDIAAQREVPAGDEIDLTLSATKDITAALDAAAPGTLLYTDSGAGFYLGHEGEHYYVLQPATTFFIDETRYTADRILVTDMDIVYDNGSTFLSAIRLVKPLTVEAAPL